MGWHRQGREERLARPLLGSHPGLKWPHEEQQGIDTSQGASGLDLNLPIFLLSSQGYVVIVVTEQDIDGSALNVIRE